MSRTIRRKGFNYNGNRNSFDHESEKDEKKRARWKEFWEASTGRKVSTRQYRWENYTWMESNYHRDNHSGGHCVPGWYCTTKYHRPMRVHVRMDIRKSILLDDWDNAIIGKRMDSNRKLAWMWF